MKKKIIILIVLCTTALLILSFFLIKKFSNNSNNNSSTTSIATDTNGTVLDAETILRLIKVKDVSNNKDSYYSSIIGRVVNYTDETDPNNLLGRPNQYTSKILFEDIRLTQEDYTNDEDFVPTGGTIEVFNNVEDMQKRKDYINSVTSSNSLFTEYSFSKKNVLIRLDKQLTQEQAKYYENLFMEAIK